MATLTGGGKLENFLQGMARRLKGGSVVKVGFFENATYPDGTPVALIAAIQNFGAPARGIPPRPFFSNMVRDKSPAWGDKLAAVLKSTNYDGEKALTLMGEGIAGQLRESIEQTNAPPLADATVKAKGFAKPLVDTGHMLNSISYEVEAGGNTTRTDTGGASLTGLAKDAEAAGQEIGEAVGEAL